MNEALTQAEMRKGSNMRSFGEHITLYHCHDTEFIASWHSRISTSVLFPASGFPRVLRGDARVENVSRHIL